MRSIAIVEDDHQSRSHLEDLLAAAAEPIRVDAFETAGELLAHIERCVRRGQPPQWDAVLVVLELGGVGGRACVRAARAALPGTLIVVLAERDDAEAILAAVRAGADGYLLKQVPGERLLEEIREVCSGGAPFAAQAARAVVHALRNGAPPRDAGEAAGSAADFGLTPRELDVLRCLARGCSYRAAAAQLGIGVDTVRSYVRSVYAKLGVHSAAEAVGRAVRARLI